ncbi:MAG: hypothetical protein R2699_05160 [Acidimicrobiales bacterium]|nr:hypothetical protein [Acidimicrobiales bacterium]MCB1248814.1 hypothetical protein [Acidimicrobiales bacterium]MCB1260872.1 hypothetical protein [Acidimicrobiales bacterium]
MAGDRRRFVLFGAVLAAAALTVVACSGEEAADTSGTTVPATQPTLPTTSTAPIEDRLDIEVVQTGVTQMPATGGLPDTATYAVVIRNPNEAWTAAPVLLSVEFYNADGAVVGTDNQRVPVVLPGFPAAAANTMAMAGVERMEVKALVDTWWPANPDKVWGTLAATDVVFSPPEQSPARVTGQITSTWSQNMKNLRLVSVQFDEGGAIVGGDTSSMAFVEKEGTGAFSIVKPHPLPPSVTRVEVVASPSSLQSTLGG